MARPPKPNENRCAAQGARRLDDQAINPTSTRAIDIFNDQLYSTMGSGTAWVYQVGSGAPATSGQTSTLLVQTTSNPYAFSISADAKTIDVADQTAGVDKYTSSTSAAGSFSPAGTFNTGAARGLAVDYGTAGGATISRGLPHGGHAGAAEVVTPAARPGKTL